MKFAIAALAVIGVFATGHAAANEKLAQSSGCMTCHALDKKTIGPSYKEVAAKYRGQKDAEAKLIEKVKKGGSGVWGQVPMPPNGHVKDADIAAMVKYILALK
jgi:cytochrome c